VIALKCPTHPCSRDHRADRSDNTGKAENGKQRSGRTMDGHCEGQQRKADEERGPRHSCAARASAVPSCEVADAAIGRSELEFDLGQCLLFVV
jgi:hypothetical protein